MRRHRALAAIKLLDHGFHHDFHLLLFERLLRESGNLGILHRQDAVHHLDHRGLGPERVIKARKFDADGTRTDDQQFFRHSRRHQRVLVGPDTITIGLQPRQFAGPRAGGDHDVRCLQLLGAGVGPDAHPALGGQARLAHERGDLVLLEQVADPGIELLGHAARTFHNRVEIVADSLGAQPEFPCPVHQVEHFRRAQHRLGRDAAPVEADAAHMLALDNCHVETKLRGPDRGHIAPRTGPDYDHVKAARCHAPLPRLELVQV